MAGALPASTLLYEAAEGEARRAPHRPQRLKLGKVKLNKKKGPRSCR
jgi:hypothetical protein